VEFEWELSLASKVITEKLRHTKLYSYPYSIENIFCLSKTLASFFSHS